VKDVFNILRQRQVETSDDFNVGKMSDMMYNEQRSEGRMFHTTGAE